ncbi:hypothetical protein [Kribbella sp. CA-294648]|uniref:hypothetical protein n=1 Tax=Kribbella sp. CA-294648 TaxID=3239948 RepID=UPI003D8FA96D
MTVTERREAPAADGLAALPRPVAVVAGAGGVLGAAHVGAGWPGRRAWQSPADGAVRARPVRPRRRAPRSTSGTSSAGTSSPHGTRASPASKSTSPSSRLTRLMQAAGTDWALGVLARSTALLTTGPAAETSYREAIDHLSRTRLRIELARAHLLYGEWLRREGRRQDAREQLRTAYNILATVGSHAFADRLHHELAATGENITKRTPHSPETLTSLEAHIAELAAPK